MSRLCTLCRLQKVCFVLSSQGLDQAQAVLTKLKDVQRKENKTLHNQDVGRPSRYAKASLAHDRCEAHQCGVTADNAPYACMLQYASRGVGSVPGSPWSRSSLPCCTGSQCCKCKGSISRFVLFVMTHCCCYGCRTPLFKAASKPFCEFCSTASTGESCGQ